MASIVKWRPATPKFTAASDGILDTVDFVTIQMRVN